MVDFTDEELEAVTHAVSEKYEFLHSQNWSAKQAAQFEAYSKAIEGALQKLRNPADGQFDEYGVPNLGTIAKATSASLMYVLRRQIEGMRGPELDAALVDLNQLHFSLQKFAGSV